MPEHTTVSHERSPYMHVLLYGEPGVGKTVVAGSSPDALILRPSTDGTESLGKFGYTPEEAVVDTWKEMWDWYDELARGDHGFKWVWLDSITLFQEMGLDDIMYELVQEKPHRDPFQPGVENYGQNMLRLSKWVRQMRTLPINFGMTAHIQRTEDHDGETRYMPAIQGKNMPEKISGYMGIVAALQVREGTDGNDHRVLLLKKDGKWYAKDRYNLTEQGYIVDPTVPKMMSLMSGGSAPRKKTTRKRTARKG